MKRFIANKVQNEQQTNEAYKKQNIVQLLVERDDVMADSKDLEGRTPLSHAAGRENEPVMRLFVERSDVQLDSKDSKGWTPIHYAAIRGNEAIVKLLFKQNSCSADLKDENGRTPLSHAAESGYDAVVKALIQRNDSNKINPDSKDNHGRTPLSYAAGGVRSSAIYISDVMSVQNFWKYPLRSSKGPHESREGHKAVVRLLVECEEVDVNSKDQDGCTPRWWATKTGHSAMVKLLESLKAA